MFNKFFNGIKRTVAGILVCAMVMVGVMLVPTEAKAATTGETGNVYTVNSVRFVEYTASEVTVGQVPVYSGVNDDYGYLFGGWYTRTGDGESAKYDYILKDATVTASKIYAKFVPAYVLSVKCQNFLDANENDTDMRIVSSIDSLNYKGVGFDLYKITKKADGTFDTQVVLGENGKQVTTNTYNYFRVYSTADQYNAYNAEQIFGDGAKYITAWRVDGITDKTCIIGVRPYWITPDDVKVYGLARYAHAEDGFENYFNVPVNLNNAIDVAAGVLNVNYSDKFEVVDVEYGQVFEEMAYADKGSSVKCVGNVEYIANGNAKSDNVYINVRLKLTSGLTENVNSYTFNVGDEDFSNVDETQFNADNSYNVWNVKSAILK